MIEAVNSVIANTQALRGNVEAIDASRSFAANPERTQVARIPQAPYVSPVIHVDLNYNTAVLQVRDSETGDVVRQFPTETALRSRTSAEQSVGSVEERVSPVTAQDVGNAQSLQSTFSAQSAIAALSTGAQTGQTTGASGTISVFA